VTSGNFHSLSTDSIRVERDDRQRRELVDIDSLADSIRRLGLINPVVVTRDNVLVAGERRLTAIRQLGWTHVTVQYVDELDQPALYAIELEENIKRVDLDWRDQTEAFLKYHELRLATETKWVQGDTAEALGVSEGEVSRRLMVAKEVRAGNARIIEAPKYSVALGIVKRNEERKDEQELTSIAVAVRPRTTSISSIGNPTITQGTATLTAVPANDGSETILNTSFNNFAPIYTGARFNLLHCDFPYGIGADGFNQGGAAAHGGYSDDEGTYWELLRTLASNLDRLTTPSCHLIFWYSMKLYQPTIEFLRKETDFVIDDFPLIWLKSDNAGILPDPSRGPRRVYETALFGRRGDRKIVQAVANAYAAPTVRDRHMSEKPEPVLRHFFRMVVDGHSLVLDPTAGSGSAIRAAEGLGAKHTLGLEINPEFAARARTALVQSRKLRNAS